MSESKKVILVTGATGKQGGATIDALVDTGALAHGYTILAVTRSPSSAGALRLKEVGAIPIQGDLDDARGLFERAEAMGHKVWGVFSVQPIGKHEEQQGKALVDAALTCEVKVFVYSSVDRGGQARSPNNPTNIPHFITKHNIEKHLFEACSSSTMKWVVLRPVAFMENLSTDFPGKVMGTAWRSVMRGKALQLVAADDIGHFAAQALLHPDKFEGRCISLAGDELAFPEANATYKARTGNELPQTFALLARMILGLAPEVGKMIRWFATEGYGADIQALRGEHPKMISFAEWLERKGHN